MLTEKEQKDVFDGCKRSNRKAQEALYKAYYRSMMTICLRYTKNEDDAVDVLNSGFLKVFQNIKRFDPGQASLYTWMRTVMVNNCLDFVKSKTKTDVHRELRTAADIHVPAEAINRLKALDLLQLIRSLPPATAAVFNLYVIEGYSHKEVAMLLGISDGTSKWHLNEARKQLQQKLKLQEAKQ